jgi:hypothetical protein
LSGVRCARVAFPSLLACLPFFLPFCLRSKPSLGFELGRLYRFFLHRNL